jgi:hypothetical protein
MGRQVGKQQTRAAVTSHGLQLAGLGIAIARAYPVGIENGESSFKSPVRANQEETLTV